MKTSRQTTHSEDSTRVALLFGLSVGLGIAVHEGFFLIAGIIAIGAATAAIAHTIHEHFGQTRLAYRAR